FGVLRSRPQHLQRDAPFDSWAQPWTSSTAGCCATAARLCAPGCGTEIFLWRVPGAGVFDCRRIDFVDRDDQTMSKILTLRETIAEFVPNGSSVALGLQMEQMIPFAAGHEMIRQKKRGLRLIGPISDILFDQLIGAGCVKDVVAAWVGNVMMGSAYNFRRATEEENPGTPGAKLKVFNMSNLSVSLALQAGAMGVPFLPARTAMGSDIPRGNHFFYQIISPFEPKETLMAVRAIQPDVTIVHEIGRASCRERV